LITTGGISTEVIKRYIETQGDNKRWINFKK
jgi:hypothetical protein